MSGLHVVFADVKGGLVPFLRLLDDFCVQTHNIIYARITTYFPTELHRLRLTIYTTVKKLGVSKQYFFLF